MPTLHTRLYTQVFDAILAGAIEPGTRLAESTLARMYDVSRSVVRRTLQRLSDEGIVDIRPNRGATVNSVDRDEARAIFQARTVVETGIIDLVCGKLSASQVAALRRVCREEHSAMVAGDRPRGLRLSAAFHLQLARATGNHLLVGYATNVMSRSALAIACLERSPPYCAYAEHPRIVDALAKGDRHHARALMVQHLEHIASNLDLDGQGVDLKRALAV